MMNKPLNESASGTPDGQVSSRRRTKTYASILALLVVAAAAIGCSMLLKDAPVHATAPAAPTVEVSQPLQKDLHGRQQFLGQFSAVDQVELRPQVGGTLTYIGFKDGDIVRKGAVLFIIDPTPYQIKFDEGSAQVASAQARLALANTELTRAQKLVKTDAGTVENVEQRLAEQRSAQAAVDAAAAFLRDAKFDLDHTRIDAPFSGRMGTHLVSIGNLILGNRGGGSAPTLLATIVSVDPIYLNFDMSEADYLSFERERASRKTALANKVEVSLTDENRYLRSGTLNFLDNTLDRSSGTIHARATVPNSDLLLTPGSFGRVRVGLTTQQSVLLVPDASVTADQADRMILVVGEGDVVKEKKVQVGGMRYGLRVVYSGLSPSDRVIVGGPPVSPEMKASVRNQTLAADSDEGGY